MMLLNLNIMNKSLFLISLLLFLPVVGCSAPEPLSLSPELNAVVSKIQLVKGSRDVTVERQCGYVRQDIRNAGSLMDAQNRLQLLAYQRGGNAVINFRLIERRERRGSSNFLVDYYFEGDAVVISGD